VDVKTVLATALVALLLAAPAEAASRPSGFAAARVTECATALAAPERHMVTEGRMRTLPRAARLSMRFDLEVRTPGRPRFAALRAPGLGVWNVTRAARQYVYAKRVENLAAPADYRTVVRFRWYDARGRRIASARRVSAVCEQPDLRPDLMPLRVDVLAAADADARRYVVPVRNTGATAAGPFAVLLTVAGRELPAQAVPGLAPGERVSLTWTAPPCAPGSTIAVEVDAEGAVDESDEADDALVRGCPG
jgi:hypothetical protein